MLLAAGRRAICGSLVVLLLWTGPQSSRPNQPDARARLSQEGAQRARRASLR